MIRTRPSRFLVRILCVAAAVFACIAQGQTTFAQAKPEASAPPAKNQPNSAPQAATQQPAAAQPAAQQPNSAKQPATQQPAAAQPAAQQPNSAKQPATQQPAAGQPAAQQPPTVRLQPAGQQPASIKPAQGKPQMGPPNPAEEARGGTAPAQPAIPAPTVQLKPGEVPGIKFDVPEYDFGQVAAGQEVSHEFWFTNTGNGPLEILTVKPS
jgi:hypothetical protein